MTTVETHIIIQAPIEKVRSIFRDYKSYSKWNPFFVSFQKYTNKQVQDLNQGDELQIDIKLKGMNHTSTIYPKILKSEENLIEWKGIMLNEWIFTGIHKFELKSIDNNTRTVFSQSEQFSGLLVIIFKLFGLYNKTQESFIEFNEALKDQAENNQD
ncbi:hypothetical protein KGF54_001780 [Candida jiufengensis]|uniref:uncharacterized protein n=1 Tax=Candida jiufengensis TaxID=497108 RepID=UPI0022244A22|nr:uncharacterized protein KGF54_001780 [Candida jiufengensis]KAI5955219.1 hypothetical protein KGF54_001780 [Candida jiufengensis]